eukprot:scaffold60788_cov64-Phaeocystis_antarctica.AAC.1
MPPLLPEQPARPKRKCPGDDTSRGPKLARKGLVTPCVRVAHGHRLRARLVLESPRVVARLELAPTRRQRRAAAAIFGAGAWTPATVTPA